MANITGNMLEDEGCLGAIHLGFGANSTIGGINEINFHLDMVIREASLRIDNIELLKGGLLCIK